MMTAPAHRPEEQGQPDEGWVAAVRALRNGLVEGLGPRATTPGDDPRDRRGPFRPTRLTPVRSRLEMQQVTRLYGWVDGAAAAVFAGLLTHLVTQGGLLAATVGEILPLAVGFAILVWALGAL
ncbi:MAG: hypothetical protein ACOVMO_05725, partial [Caulobacter sp.]